MTGSNSRKRVTVIASTEAVDRAEKALIRLGFESKTKFAEAQLLARNAVTKFFNRQPVQPDTFKRVCDGLKLDWQEILGSEINVEIGQSEETGHPEVVEMSATATSETVGTTLAITRRQVTVLDHQQGIKAKIVLAGDIDSVDANFKSTLEVLLKCYGGDTIEIIDIQSGSIRITIQGSRQHVERLRERIVSGELTQIDDFPIEDLMILGDASLESPENLSLQTKWELIQAIKAQPQLYRQLKDIDLSDADLSNANLRGFDLSGADLSGTDLSGAVLSEADLRRTDLRGALLSKADLSGAVLSEADLSGAVLRGTDLRGTDLRGTDLSWTDLRGTIIDISTQLEQKWQVIHEILNQGASGRDLSGTDLKWADLRRADLRRANLRGSDLSGTDLSEADLSDADLRRANLRGTIINTSTQLEQKWRLVHEIVNQEASGRDLSGTDLSDADLWWADLSRAVLSGTNLSGAVLSGANLRRADLRSVDLRWADLSEADLRRADLRGADLNGAMVQNARFGEGVGLSQEEKQDLARRGAIFGDTSGDRELVYY